jgi:hypothetical protein
MRRWRILCCVTALVGAVPECAAAPNVELTVSSPFRRADGKVELIAVTQKVAAADVIFHDNRGLTVSRH